MKRNLLTFIEVILVLLIIVLIARSCEKSVQQTESAIQRPAFETKNTSDPLEAAGKLRIKPLGNFDGVYIYDIDGHIYNCNTNGGIVHSESCPCKLNANTH